MATDNSLYDALALPNEALANGGAEILRAGVIDDELFVVARRAFKDPAQWGEVLGDIVQRLAILYAAETDLTEQEVIATIESAFAAELGAPILKEPRRKPGAKPARAKTSTKPRKAKTKPRSKAGATASRAKTARAKPRAKRK